MSFWDLPDGEWQDHYTERCQRCGGRLKKDPVGGFYLRCKKCGWAGW